MEWIIASWSSSASKKNDHFLFLASGWNLKFDPWTTVLPVKSDSEVVFCLQKYQGLIIDRSLVY